MLRTDSCVLYIKGLHAVHTPLDNYSPLLSLKLLLFPTFINHCQTPATRERVIEGIEKYNYFRCSTTTNVL